MGNGLVPVGAWKPVGIDSLEDSALAAVRSTGNTLVTAGPGAGKTELLGQRGVFLMQTGLCPYPRRVLAISFKRDAARNLRERFERRCTKQQAERLNSMTFDAFAKQLFDRFWRSLPDDWALKTPYKIAFTPSRNEVVNFQRTVASSLSQPDAIGGRALALAAAPVTPNDVMALSYDDFNQGIQSLSLSPFSVPNESAFLHLARLLWAFDQNPALLTFQMIGRLVQAIVDHNPVINHAIRATYSHVFVDEFQDTTYVQYELMRSIFGGSDTIITAVGDDKQKIMGSAGAQNHSFREFTADFLGGGAALGRSRLTLKFNYRSNARIVEILKTLRSASLRRNLIFRPSARRRICQTIKSVASSCRRTRISRIRTSRPMSRMRSSAAYRHAGWGCSCGRRPTSGKSALLHILRRKALVFAMKTGMLVARAFRT